MKKAKLQIRKFIQIDASSNKVWEVLLDAHQLSSWMPAVDQVLECDPEGEGLGSERRCQAKLAGKAGTIVEKVVEHVPGQWIRYAVIDDTFGMSKMFNDYSFQLSTAEIDGQTQVTSTTYYEPRNPFVALLNLIMMKRQFSSVLEAMLDGLKRHVESADWEY
ncbi:SRPBCC family protein [Pacificispira sp.]|uniref:SRPBCC family protein n=1 Tax=Pacificispira sp. TaxID=2888761 RepID=UPI003B5297BB